MSAKVKDYFIRLAILWLLIWLGGWFLGVPAIGMACLFILCNAILFLGTFL